MADIDKKSLEHLAKLARIELDPRAEDKLVKDLGGILDHFKELQSLDTKAVIPMTGGTSLQNVFREDVLSDTKISDRRQDEVEAIRKAFPEKEKNFLVIPPVFE